MTIVFPCGGCGQKLEVERGQAGRRVGCPTCGQVLTVPVPRPPTPAARPAPAPATRSVSSAPPAPSPAAWPRREEAGPAVDLFDEDLEQEEEGYDAPPPMRFATASSSSFGRARHATPRRSSGDGAAIAAVVAVAVVAVGGLITLAVWLTSKYGGAAAEPDDHGAPSDGVVARHEPARAKESGSQLEGMFEEMMTLTEESANLLAEVRDEESARRVATQISGPLTRLFQLTRQFKTMPEPPVDVGLDLMGKYKARGDALGQRFLDECNRLVREGPNSYARPVFEVMHQLALQFPDVLNDAAPGPQRLPFHFGPPPMAPPAPGPAPAPAPGRPPGYGPSGVGGPPSSGYYGTPGGPNANSPGYGPSAAGKGGTSGGYGGAAPGAQTPGYSPNAPGGTAGGYGNNNNAYGPGYRPR